MCGTVCRRNGFPSGERGKRVSHALVALRKRVNPHFSTAWNGGWYRAYGGTVPFQTVPHGRGSFAQAMNNPGQHGLERRLVPRV